MATLTQKTAQICKVSSFYWPVRSLYWHLLGSDGHVNFIIERQNMVTACIINLKGTDGGLNWFSLIASWLARQRHMYQFEKGKSFVFDLLQEQPRRCNSSPARPALICYAMCCIMWWIITHQTLMCLALGRLLPLHDVPQAWPAF